MTDKELLELLELAAKAAGIVVIRSRLDDPLNADFLVETSARNINQHSGAWNPLTDDGDCARMEARVMVNVKWYPFSVVASASAHDCSEFYVDHGINRAKARRYASVRAAAEIGRAMP